MDICAGDSGHPSISPWLIVSVVGLTVAAVSTLTVVRSCCVSYCLSVTDIHYLWWLLYTYWCEVRCRTAWYVCTHGILATIKFLLLTNYGACGTLGAQNEPDIPLLKARCPYWITFQNCAPQQHSPFTPGALDQTHYSYYVHKFLLLF